MKKLVIPLFIPLKNNYVDYESLKNIVNDIENSIILIGNYGINELSSDEYITIYLYLKLIDNKNEYFIEENYNDSIINSFINNENYIISKLGNVLSNEINEYLLNEELEVVDKSLNKYLKMFKNSVAKDEKKIIEYILYKKKKISSSSYPEIDNLLGINEI